jgi:uncharacterized damage-inducible protein DinB
MNRLDEVRELYAFNRWANDRIIAACQALPPVALGRDLQTSFGSVLGTLAHIAKAEWIWLERWNGRSPLAPPAWNTDDAAALARHWRAVQQAQRSFLDGLTSDALDADVAYRNLEGEAFVAPLWQLMRHMVNHSTYHRGQIVTLLRQLGAQAPATDLVLYYREHPAIEAV